MIEISKLEVIPLLSAYYQKQLAESTLNIYNFTQKYACGFEDFEKRVKSSEKESFEEWDDYISWKGHLRAAKNLSETIKKIEDGLFQLT